MKITWNNQNHRVCVVLKRTVVDCCTWRPVPPSPVMLHTKRPSSKSRPPRDNRAGRNGSSGGGGSGGSRSRNPSSNPAASLSSSLGPRRVDGSRSDPTRAGLGLDESEWEEPERLSSTPMPSPMGSTRGGGGGGGGKMTPMTVRGLGGGGSGGGVGVEVGMIVVVVCAIVGKGVFFLEGGERVTIVKKNVRRSRT